MELDILIEILEKSIEKNGVKPLTNQWLLNILKQANKQIEKLESDHEYDGFDPNWD